MDPRTARPGASAAVGSGSTLLEELETVVARLRQLAAADWAQMPTGDAKTAVGVLEQASRHTSAITTSVVARVASSRVWEGDGQRTMSGWMTSRTGSTRNSAHKTVELAESLHEHLPETKDALAKGLISEDHAQVISRECTKTPVLRTRLLDPARGEAFLIRQAQDADATAFAKIAKGWAIETDPKGADRAWRQDAAKEDLTLTPTGQGYRLSGWLTPLSAALVQEALDAHAGRKAAGDLRTFPQRLAAALVSMARQSLDAGFQMPSARIRPHLTITMDYTTIHNLITATGENTGTSGENTGTSGENTGTFGEKIDDGAGGGAGGGAFGSGQVISTGVDYDQLTGTPPATLADGTPLPPAVLARLMCESMLTRVVFGPKSTILDVGRAERIFPAHHARAIIARDRTCRYPGCDAGPSRSEIHHSLEWFKHNGTTHVDLGVLICYHHHDLIHEQNITITRREGDWIFTTSSGMVIKPPGHSPPEPTSLTALRNLDTTIAIARLTPPRTGKTQPPPRRAPSTTAPTGPPRTTPTKTRRRSTQPRGEPEPAALFDPTTPPF